MFTRPPLSYVPMAPALVGVVAGVLLASLLTGVTVGVVACVAMAASVVLTIIRRRWAGRAVFFLGLAVVSAWAHRPAAIPPRCLHGHYGLVGVVKERGATMSGSRLTVAGGDGFDVMLYVRGVSEVAEGDSVKARVRLSRPRPGRWPYQFDYARYLSRKGVEVSGNVAADSLEVIGRSPAVKWRLKRVQQDLAERLRRSELSDESTRFLVAALLGDSSDLTPDDRARFSSAGIAHLLALSGTHVAVITVLIGFLLFPLYLLRRRRALLAATVVLLWVYAVMTGLSPSVVRAVLMATVVAGAYILERPSSAFNSLLTAAVVILLFDPAALRSVSFQLSVMAVAGILLVTRLTYSRLREVVTWRWALWLLSAVIVTLAATMATAPLTVKYFGVFPVYFLLANIPAMLLIAPLLAGGALVELMSLLGLPTGAVCCVVDVLYGMLDGVIAFVERLPGYMLSNIQVSTVTLVAWMVATVVVMLLLWRPRVRPFWCVGGVAIAVVAVGLYRDSRRGSTDVAEEMFIVNDSRYAGLLYRNGSRAWLLTPEPPRLALTLLGHAQRRHSGYLSHYGVDSIAIAGDTLAVGHLVRDRRRVTFSGETMMFVNSDTTTIGSDVKVALVCRGTTRGELSRLRRSRVDSVVMMPSSHWRVGRTFTDSLPGKSVVSYRATILHRFVGE